MTASATAKTRQATTTTTPWPVDPRDQLTETGDINHAMYLSRFEQVVIGTGRDMGAPIDADARHAADAPCTPRAPTDKYHSETDYDYMPVTSDTPSTSVRSTNRLATRPTTPST